MRDVEKSENQSDFYIFYIWNLFAVMVELGDKELLSEPKQSQSSDEWKLKKPPEWENLVNGAHISPSMFRDFGI